MANLQELFTKVTGLTWDVNDVIDDKEKLAWLVPDGAMLDGDAEKNKKAQDTLEFIEAAGLDKNMKFGYDDVEDDEDDSSEDDVDNEPSTVDVDVDDDI